MVKYLIPCALLVATACSSQSKSDTSSETPVVVDTSVVIKDTLTTTATDTTFVKPDTTTKMQ